MHREIEILDQRRSYAPLREYWNALAVEDPDNLRGDDATASFEWFEAILEAFPEADESRVIVAWENSRIIGILPLLIDRNSRLGPRLMLPTETYGGRSGPLLQEPGSRRILGDLLGGLDLACPGWVSLAMTLVTGSRASLAAMDAIAKGGYRALVGEARESLFFPLESDEKRGWSGVAKDVRQRIRQTERKLAEEENACLLDLRYSRAEDSDALLDSILEIERHSWKHRAGSAITNHPRQQNFYRALLPRAIRSGMLAGHLLLVAGRPVAYLLGLSRSGVFVDLKNSYVDDFDHLSISHFVRYRSILSLARSGNSRFDFMGLIEPHKRRYSAANRTYARQPWTIYNRTSKGLAVHALWQLRNRIRHLQEYARRGTIHENKCSGDD